MEPQVSKLLSGGLNLLAAGDAVPEGQCIAAQNWRSDRSGNLRGRKSNSAAIQTFTDPVTSIVTALRATGPQRYYGAGTGAGGEFYRDATAIATGLTKDPLQPVSFQGRVWIMNPNVQKKDDGLSTFAWTPAKATAAPTFTAGGAASGGLNGNYSYYVTGVTEEGEETNPSPARAVTGLGANDSVDLTRPAFTDAQITQWNAYRQGGSFPLQAYKVNSVPIPISTTVYIDLGVTAGTNGDDQTDLGIASLGVAMAIDHDPAPAAKGLAGPYFGKLLAFNSLLHPNRIWWTPSDEPSYFPGSQSEQDGNWVDVGEEGEHVEAIAVYPRMVIILKERTIHRLVGDPDDLASDIERTNVEIGQIGPKAWAAAGQVIYLQATEGVYGTASGSVYLGTSDSAGKLTGPLDPIFKQDTILTAGTIPSAPVHPTANVRSGACMAYRNGRLYFSYPSANAAAPQLLNDTTLVFDAGQWFTDSRGFTALYDEGQGGGLLGAIGGSVYQIETGSAEANIPLIYQSRYEDQGAPENKKRYADFVIDHNTQGRTFTVYAYLDNGTTVLNLGTFSSTARTQTTFTLGDDDEPAEYRNISIRIESDTGNAESEIYAIVVHYLPLERNARSYDTGKIPIEKVSLLGALEFDLEIVSGKVDFRFWAGLHGLEEIAKGEFTGAERTFTAQLPNPETGGLEARWIRLTLTGDNYRCHGARLQVQPYGVYLAGVGDIFRSGDLTFGTPRPKLLQQIRIGCQPDDATAGQFFSDLPGPMGPRQALSLVRSTGRGWQRQTFPVNTRGRVCRVEVTAAAPCRIFEIQVRVKVIGEPGGWSWQDVPVPETPSGFSWMPLPIT
ncbi:MAG: hypothetical protein LAP40_16970 [Acidobacteriia bacterium]|nr:hypothetical protein [Terriglobia bacterium]